MPLVLKFSAQRYKRVFYDLLFNTNLQSGVIPEKVTTWENWSARYFVECHLLFYYNFIIKKTPLYTNHVVFTWTLFYLYLIIHCDIIPDAILINFYLSFYSSCTSFFILIYLNKILSQMRVRETLEDDMSEAPLEYCAPHWEPLHIVSLDTNLCQVNDQLSVSFILVLYWLSLGEVWGVFSQC